MGLSPLAPGLWLDYTLSSQNPLGVNQCMLEEPWLLLKQALHQPSYRLQEGGPRTLSTATYEKMFFSLNPSYWLSILATDKPFPYQCSLTPLQNPYIPINFVSTLELQDKTQLLPSSLLPSSHGILAIHVLFLMWKYFESDPKLTLGLLLPLTKMLEPCTVHLQATW